MDNKTFKELIYQPYNECWSIIKTIQNSKSSGSNEEWEEWVRLSDEFIEKHDDMIGHILYQMLLALGDEIGKLNG